MTRLRPAALGLVALLLASCFDPPIEEQLELAFLADGGIEATVVVTVAGDAEDDGNPALSRRVREVRQSLLEGWDDWTRRFERVEAERETLRWVKEEGRLTLHQRTARLRDAQELDRFLGDTGVSVFYRESDGEAELALYPGSSTRAGRRQRQQVEEALGEWTAALADYLDRGRELYRYLDVAPERAPAVFAALFEDLVESSEAERLGSPLPTEEQLLEGLFDAMERCWSVLLVEAGEAYSLDELSQRVYDPFPARIVVRPPSPPGAVEGFAASADDALVIERIGLWTALASLESRWLHPDPLPIYVRHARSSEPIDVERLASEPRRAEPGVGVELLRSEIESRLEPAPAYRAAWSLSP